MYSVYSLMFCNGSFRNDPCGQSTSTATQELLRLIESDSSPMTSLDPIKDLHLRDIDFVEKLQRYLFLKKDFENYACLQDPQFLENVTSPSQKEL